MAAISRLILASTVLLMLSACAHSEHGAPSALAVGVAGEKGTIEFTPNDRIAGETSWWKDSYGVMPGVAGCHIGTDEQGEPNGRIFGEACLENGL